MKEGTNDINEFPLIRLHIISGNTMEDSSSCLVQFPLIRLHKISGDPAILEVGFESGKFPLIPLRVGEATCRRSIYTIIDANVSINSTSH
ncbi:hypothetical protein [Nostoc sp. UCD120]|uniref:hypothetical protein n=1 Tax=Nostoc sp. UCD120 TaxID=2681312 RepID=UPI001625BD4A|nr:hypothetical protein [Nostoc sp. UCD120]MBC1220695.1 hypothetical protein [Nostoc sp. UCD120]